MRLPAIATAHSSRELTVEATAWSPSRGADSERTTRIGAACGGPDVAFMVRNNRHVRLDHLQALDVIPAGQFPRKRKLMATPDADGRGSPGWGKRSPCDGSSSSVLRRPTSADSDYDVDSETLCYSLTLPTIEAVLTEEGISSRSISQQMAQIRERCRSRCHREPPIFPRSQLNELRLPPRSLESLSEPPTTRATPRPSLLTALLTDRLLVGSPRRRTLPAATNDKLSASVPVAPQVPDINVHSNDVQRNIDDFLDEIERTKWLSRQQLESTNMGPWFVAPRILVMPNNVLYGSSLLENVVQRNESVLTVEYVSII
ncbi:hypothetical protein NP493_1020g00011 [Ridgeia piscesae]|uniref:Uncharacterized protein n=1 Tax=Ridgeia piscesae TaxID=27915 RepID=A0AAD9KIC8_RIDPI|nr:hypothetical protein NP493_1020g00011 [Ridgeia piscesae]